MKYAYWGVICKTPNCGLIPAKYLGPHEGTFFYTLPDAGPGWWEVPCAGCGQTHRYTRHDLQVKALDVPPPPDFREWW